MNIAEHEILTHNQKKRRPELDIFRAISILGLPFVHCYEEFDALGFLVPAVAKTGSVFLGLCALGPSVFMAILGMNIVFSSHGTPGLLFRRGITTLFYGVLLNVVRFVLPCIVAGLCGRLEFVTVGIYYSIASDILYFAGLVFLFFAFVKKCSIQPVYVLVISLAMLACNMVITSAAPVTNKYFDAFLGNFAYINDESYFPFLSWIVYPAVGYMLGEYIKKLETVKDSDSFYLRMFLICGTGLAALCICLKSYKIDPLVIAASPANAYINDLFTVVITLLLGGIWLAFWYAICRHVRSQKFTTAAYLISDAILVFYAIQWSVIGWTEYMLAAAKLDKTHFMTPFMFAVISILIFIISLIISLGFKQWERRRQAANKGK